MKRPRNKGVVARLTYPPLPYPAFPSVANSFLPFCERNIRFSENALYIAVINIHTCARRVVLGFSDFGARFFLRIAFALFVSVGLSSSLSLSLLRSRSRSVSPLRYSNLDRWCEWTRARYKLASRDSVRFCCLTLLSF